jgi:hypothetical protein
MNLPGANVAVFVSPLTGLGIFAKLTRASSSGFRVIAKINFRIEVQSFALCSPSATSPRPSPPLRGGEGDQYTQAVFSEIYFGNHYKIAGFQPCDVARIFFY